MASMWARAGYWGCRMAGQADVLIAPCCRPCGQLQEDAF